MKVLYLTNIPSPYRVDFFSELGKLCDLTVLFERRQAKDRDAGWLKGTCEHFAGVLLKGFPIGKDSALCPDVIRYLRKGAFDRIIIGGYATPTGMLAIQYLSYRNMPFLLNSDGGFVKDDGRLKHAIKRHFISSASAWFSTGKLTDEYLIHYGAKPSLLYRYPFTSLRGADILEKPVTDEDKAVMRYELGMPERKIVLSVGQFIHRKGFDVLMQASAGLGDDVGVYIVGGEPTAEYLAMKNELHLEHVHFSEFKQKDELKRYYAAADVFVLPTREDVWGLVINEAMACGLPVVTTDRCIAGLEVVKDGENGFIVAVDDVEALTEKTRLILNDDKTRSMMSSNSLSSIRNYTIECMAQIHCDLLLT